jgi:hypothetical protein
MVVGIAELSVKEWFIWELICRKVSASSNLNEERLFD